MYEGFWFCAGVTAGCLIATIIWYRAAKSWRETSELWEKAANTWREAAEISQDTIDKWKDTSEVWRKVASK